MFAIFDTLMDYAEIGGKILIGAFLVVVMLPILFPWRFWGGPDNASGRFCSPREATMTDRDFWQAVYVAAIRAGLNVDTAVFRADAAVERLRMREGLK